MRRQRRTLIQSRLSFLEHGRKVRDRLLERASKTSDPDLVDAAMVIDESLKQALRDVEVFAAIPNDAKVPCACQEESFCRLPSVLTEQTFEITA